MPFGLGLISGLLGGVADIGKMIFGSHQDHLANQIHPQFTQYQTSPYAKMQLGLAQNAYNSPMPGTQDIFRGIQSGQSNQIANINRNATDSGQALALAAGTQGQANNAFTNLGVQEGQYKTGMLNNLNNAYQAMTEEGNKVYQSQLEKYQMDLQQQNALRNAGSQNLFGGAGDLATGFNLFGQQQQQNNFNNQLMQLLGNGGGSSGVI